MAKSGTSDLSARRVAQLHKDLDRFGIQDKTLRAALVKADIILVDLLAGKPLQNGVEALIMGESDRPKPNGTGIAAINSQTNEDQ